MIRELQFFLRLCRDGSIRKASQSLSITPQGLSKAMKSLEAELGVQLFTRSNEGIVPTAAGNLVAKRAKAIVDGYANLKLELGEFGPGFGNHITITVAAGVIHALQPDFLYEYRAGYPEVELMVGEYPDIPGERTVRDGEAEVGFAIGPVDRRVFDSSPLRSGALSVIVKKTHPLAAKGRLGFRDLVKEKWIVPNEDYKTHHAIVSKCAELGVTPKLSMRAGDIAAIFKFCHLEEGVGFASEWMLAESGYDSLKSVPLADDSACAWDIHLVTRKRTPLSPAARGFVDHVRAWFGKGG